VSEGGPAPPTGAAKMPERPASQPSRVPLVIWSSIALLCLVLFGSALGLFLWSREAFSSKDLKKATAVKITYYVRGGQTKSVEVKDPAELKSLLDALEIDHADTGMQVGLANQGSVDFTLPDGTNARVMFVKPTQLNRANWGQVYVTPAFYQKVNDIATRAEGRPIDIMKTNN
jgi:hypothetical protein